MDMNNLSSSVLEVDIANIQSVSEEEYALARRKGFGASDMSILLDTNPYTKPLDLIAQKRTTVISEEERAIGKKDAVRKGKDLEPLIIEKASKLLGLEIFKPPHQYKFKEYPYLKINFDGVSVIDGQNIPIECKFVTTYGDKYYDRTKAYAREIEVPAPHQVQNIISSPDLVAKIEARAQAVGIPPYYYVQLQDQMMGLKAPYGYLAALHDKGWELCIYKAYPDEEVQNAMIVQGYQYWKRVTE